MSRFYLDDYATDLEFMSDSDVCIHAMRREVNDRSFSDALDDREFRSIHVHVIDAMLPFAWAVVNEDQLSMIALAIHNPRAAQDRDADALAEIYDAINFLNRKRYLRKRRLSSGRTGYELAYLTRGAS